MGYRLSLLLSVLFVSLLTTDSQAHAEGSDTPSPIMARRCQVHDPTTTGGQPNPSEEQWDDACRIIELGAGSDGRRGRFDGTCRTILGDGSLLELFIESLNP